MNVYAEALLGYLETPDGKALVRAALTGAPIPPPPGNQDAGGA